MLWMSPQLWMSARTTCDFFGPEALKAVLPQASQLHCWQRNSGVALEGKLPSFSRIWELPAALKREIPGFSGVLPEWFRNFIWEVSVVLRVPLSLSFPSLNVLAKDLRLGLVAPSTG